MPTLSSSLLPEAHDARDRRNKVRLPLQPFDAWVHAADGAEFPVDVVVRRTACRWRVEFVVVIRDLSKYDLAQIELRRYAEQLLLTKQVLESHNALLEQTIWERTEELRGAKEEAELANAAKSNFLASMSHELRTPLHAILSFSRFGQRRMGQCSPEKLQQYFQTIEKCGNTLLDLVNQLLDLAKLESGRMDLDKRCFDLAETIDDVRQSLDVLAEERQIKIAVHHHELPLLLLGDRERLTQVIRNLLSNALKVSPTGGPVDIHTEATDRTILLRVADQGPGIPSGELDRIFEKFVQGSLPNNRNSGTGLGLAICREIITLHGGRMWAENLLQGAAFYVELPRHLLLVHQHDNIDGMHGVNQQALEHVSSCTLSSLSQTPESNRCLQETAC